MTPSGKGEELLKSMTGFVGVVMMRSNSAEMFFRIYSW